MSGEYNKNKNTEDEDLASTLQVSNKAKRMEDEEFLKTQKWSFSVPEQKFNNHIQFS
jgi:hypothetical protein